MIKFTNVSAGLFRVFVGRGNKGDTVEFKANISRHGRNRQTYVSKGKFRVLDKENAANYVIDGSVNALSNKPEFDLDHLTPHTVSLIAEDDDSEFICVNYKNKKNVKEVKIDEVILLSGETYECVKRDFVLVKPSGEFKINDVYYKDVFYGNVLSEKVIIESLSKIKVIRFYV